MKLSSEDGVGTEIGESWRKKRGSCGLGGTGMNERGVKCGISERRLAVIHKCL